MKFPIWIRASIGRALEQHKWRHTSFLIALVVNKLYFIYSYDNIVLRLKYAIFRKKLQIKVFQHRILGKKVREGICLSPPSGAGGLERYGLNIKLYRNGKYALFQKRLKSKFFGIEFRTKKSARAYVYLPPQSGARGLETWYGLNIKLHL